MGREVTMKRHKPYKPYEHSARWLAERAIRYQRVLGLWLTGLTYAEIGRMMGVTRQYVQQQIAPGIETQRAVRARAKHLCESCGTRERRFRHHIHHRSRTLQYNRLSNLALLCQSCHKVADAAQVQARQAWDRANNRL